MHWQVVVSYQLLTLYVTSTFARSQANAASDGGSFQNTWGPTTSLTIKTNGV
jgi:hypothetical protein